MTRKTDIKVRPGTNAEFAALVGETKNTVRFYVVDMGGEVVGFAAHYVHNGNAYVFSKVQPELKPHRRFIIRAAKAYLGTLKTPAICVADENEPGSRRFLEFLGWEHIGPSPQGEVYRWVKNS